MSTTITLNYDEKRGKQEKTRRHQAFVPKNIKSSFTDEENKKTFESMKYITLEQDIYDRMRRDDNLEYHIYACERREIELKDRIDQLGIEKLDLTRLLRDPASFRSWKTEQYEFVCQQERSARHQTTVTTYSNHPFKITLVNVHIMATAEGEELPGQYLNDYTNTIPPTTR